MDTGPVYDHHHAVQFYGDDDGLCTTVAGFLGQGFVDGHPAIVIATPEHSAAILAQLRGRMIDVARAQQSGSLIVLDAEKTLELFMSGGEPDATRFEKTLGKMISKMLAGREDRILIRAYGEMVDLLWKQGRLTAAIEIEKLWNALAQRYGFALLCGYSMSNFDRSTIGFESICREHTHVVAPLSDSSVRRRVN